MSRHIVCYAMNIRSGKMINKEKIPSSVYWFYGLEKYSTFVR